MEETEKRRLGKLRNVWKEMYGKLEIWIQEIGKQVNRLEGEKTERGY